MRDPARIDTILEQLREVWMLNPDLRLGQLVYNAARMRDPNLADVFNIEDEALSKGLRRYKERINDTGVQ
jgi:hypothetical protein